MRPTSTSTIHGSSAVAPGRDLPGPGLLLGGVILLGAALRFYRLGHWNLGDEAEIFTLRDSLVTTWLQGPKPLLFFLNHHLIAPWHQLDEFGLRLLPAIFGVATIPVIYWVTARTLGERAGLFAAFALAVHPWHIYWSQFARYYSLVILCSAVFPIATYQAMKEQRIRHALVAVCCAVLAILAHPSAGLLLAGLGVWALVLSRGRLRLRDRLGKLGPAAAVVGVAIIGLTTYYLSAILLRWYLFDRSGGHAGPTLLLSYFDGLTLTLVTLSAAGFAVLWTSGDRRVALLLTCLAVVPILFLFAISYAVPVYNSYLLATAPVFFITAGHFLDRVAAGRFGGIQPRLVAGTCLALLMVAFAPRIWAHYQDGGRIDFRSGARYITTRAAPGDIVLADQHRLLSYYAPALAPGYLVHEPAVLQDSLDAVQRRAQHGTLWLATMRLWRGGFNDQALGDAAAWVTRHCRFEVSLATPRLDYKQNELQIYRCGAGRPAPRNPHVATPP